MLSGTDDTRLGPPWWLLMNILVFPLGTVGGLLFLPLLVWFEGMVLGDGWHFSNAAEVCFIWMVMFFLGHLQWFQWFGRRPPATAANEPSIPPVKRTRLRRSGYRHR